MPDLSHFSETRIRIIKQVSRLVHVRVRKYNSRFALRSVSKFATLFFDQQKSFSGNISVWNVTRRLYSREAFYMICAKFEVRVKDSPASWMTYTTNRSKIWPRSPATSSSMIQEASIVRRHRRHNIRNNEFNDKISYITMALPVKIISG